ncbi:MAG: hypothetical protein JW832_13520, partial [Deltaproteobacteria bacterium]|nr:hypothetical protein [Deltaproteobacteria bacterium]
MGAKAYFPKVTVRAAREGGVVASAGLELKSILKADLLHPESGSAEAVKKDLLDQKTFQRLREGLLAALAAWPSTVSLELHLATLPDLAHRARGRIFIQLFLSVQAPDEAAAREEVLVRYIALAPLLQAYWPEAEFLPVAGRKPGEVFTATHALAVRRVTEDV